MARTAIAAQSLPLANGASYFPALPLTVLTANLTMTAADASNFNVTPIVSGKTVLLVQNSDVSAHTITIHSVADAQNRTGDITTYSIAAAAIASFGPFTTQQGWNQTSPAGLWYDCNSALLLVAVITLP